MFSSRFSWGTTHLRDYDPLDSEICYRSIPNRVMYSLPQDKSNKKDYWRVFLPANRKDFKDSADFIGWYASKGYYQGFERTDARSLYLAYHEGYGGFKKKSYRKKQWLVKVSDRVQARSTKYQQQYWGCAQDLKKKKFLFFG